MNFLWLEYFSAVAEEKSIRGAAARMYVSDQAVSEVIKKLEKELGAHLLQRTRPQTITPAGAVLYRYATEILALKQQMVTEIAENYADARKNTIRIGISAFGSPDFLPALLERVRIQIPGVRLELVQQPSINAKDFSGADLYFPLIPLDDSLEHVILRRDGICVLASQSLLEKTYGDEWEAACQALEQGRLPAFQALPFIDIQSAAVPGFARHLICEEDEFQISPLIYTESKETLFSLCADGYGAAVVMKSHVRQLLDRLPIEKRNALRVYPLLLDCGQTDISISHRLGKRLSPLERQFIQIAKDFFAS